jgi:pimeloyl-ACP methyl ester carboxylesterase
MTKREVQTMTQAIETKIETLNVPGADLYYEVRGTGPVLLMMPGGPADATAFRSIAGHLATNFTVVTYDPRGLSRSKLASPLDEERIVEVFADDVHRLLASITKEKADVFASSGGAVIALELAASHPEQLNTVVSHEPPSPTLLPDPARVRATMEQIASTYRTAGIGPAVEIFSDLVGGGPPPAPEGEPTPEMREDMARMQGNMDLFFGPYMVAIARYEPDYAALKAAPCRIIAAVGDDSRGELAHDGGLGLAERLGTQAVVFPGDHGGFQSHPAEFATRLREVLEG